MIFAHMNDNTLLQSIMIKSINISFEEADTLQLSCSNCSHPIISLHQATSFLKVANTTNPKLYFVLASKDHDEHCKFIVDKDSFYIEVAPHFFLMQLGKVQCGGCKFEIGIIVN
jgi:hypothetical protein